MSDDTVVELPAKRGPGRPPREEEVKAERRRRGRGGLERHLRLHIPDELLDPAFSYRWINDNMGRLQQKTQMDDWDVVPKEDLKGRDNVRVVGRGSDGLPLRAYLCRKPKEYYDADQKETQDQLDAEEKAVLTHQKTAGGDKGLAIGGSDQGYVPGKSR